MGLVAVFDNKSVYIVDVDNNTIVLTGHRDAKTKLWMIALQPITPDEERSALLAAQATEHKHICNATCAPTIDTAGDRVELFSRTFCSPAESTIINAVKKKWIRYPGINIHTLKRQRRRLRTHESAAGHLDQVYQNRTSTQTPCNLHSKKQNVASNQSM